MSKYSILKNYEQILMMIEDILGSGVTTNVQLTKLGRMITGMDFLGAFCSDEMPKYIKENRCFILNTDSSNSNNKNGHWVGFYKINNKLYYSDSFNRSKGELSNYWINKRMYNAKGNDRDQSFMESDCGSRSLSFLVVFRKYKTRCIGII